ncbi:hypothetical protein OAO34_06765 [Candidatus Poseidoniaceae archaeon]|nr:hypothetical protein [Candidatus Poseidoniaceae archaeon]
MDQLRSGFVVIILISISLAGCFSEDEERSGFDLQINYDSLNGTIIQSYSDGELVSSEFVTITFDFSDTNSEEQLSIYGIEIHNHSETIEINANDESKIPMEFSEHGIYELEIYAIDEGGNRESQVLNVQIQLRIDWTEMNTDNPIPLMFDPTPANGGEHPIMIDVESTIENPNPIQEFGNGQSVQITWNIVDEYDDTCQRNSDQVENGDSVTWSTIHFNTYLIHELIVDYDDGQDDINVMHSISIIYNSE